MKLFVAVLATIGKLIPFPVIWKLWDALCHMDSRKERPLYFYTGYAPNWFYVEMKREGTMRSLRCLLRTQGSTPGRLG